MNRLVVTADAAKSSIAAQVSQQRDLLKTSVVHCTAFREKYLRSANPDKPWERSCRMGQNCEAAKLFVNHTTDARFFKPGRELLSPEARHVMYTTQKLPEKRDLCLLCRLRVASNIVTAAQAALENVSLGAMACTFQDLFDYPGELRYQNVLVNAPIQSYGLPGPVYNHRRTAYDPELCNNDQVLHFHHKPTLLCPSDRGTQTSLAMPPEQSLLTFFH